MSTFDLSRTDIGLDPIVRSSSGARRPALGTPLDTFVVHYVGAGNYLDRTLKQAVLDIEAWAASQSKPNEYNTVSDELGATAELAGPYRAAHSTGDNSDSWGHCLTLGVQGATTAQLDGLIAGVRRTRAQAVAAGYLTPNHRVMQHRRMPGGRKSGTNCPGPLICRDDVWARIAAPLDTTTPNPDPAPDPVGDEDDMAATLWNHPDYDEVFLVGSGPPINVSPAVFQSLLARGVPVVMDDKADHKMLDDVLRLAGRKRRSLTPKKK